MKAEIEGNKLSINLMDVFMGLDVDSRKAFLETFTIEEVLQAVERQLKHETELYWWDTGGGRDGATLRASILKIQGLEPEFKKDLESKISSLEHNVAHYKKFYDWYFKVYHLNTYDKDGNKEHIIDKLHRIVGNPTQKEGI